jgi:hypothetical protein
MPRLLGKSSKAPLYLGATVLILIGTAIVLEYLGTIDVVPGFGQDRNHTRLSEPSNGKISNTLDTN